MDKSDVVLGLGRGCSFVVCVCVVGEAGAASQALHVRALRGRLAPCPSCPLPVQLRAWIALISCASSSDPPSLQLASNCAHKAAPNSSPALTRTWTLDFRHPLVQGVLDWVAQPHPQIYIFYRRPPNSTPKFELPGPCRRACSTGWRSRGRGRSRPRLRHGCTTCSSSRRTRGGSMCGWVGGKFSLF